MAPLRRPLIIVLLLAGLTRALALGAGWDALRDDPDAYTALSQTLARTGTFGLTGADGAPSPTAFRPPLYPALLALLSRAIIAVNPTFADPLAAENASWFHAGVALLHWALALVTVAATYCAAHRLLRPLAASADPRKLHWAPSVASLLVALDPILLQYSTRVMTETLATALAALALWTWAVLVDRLPSASSADQEAGRHDRDERRILGPAVALGSLLALAYLCRPTFIVWTGLLLVYLAGWALWELKNRRVALRLLAASVPILMISAVVLGGWTLRNQRQLGHPIWATTHGGYTLLLGNNPPFYHYVRTGRLGIAWDPEFFFERWEQRFLTDPRASDFWDPTALVVADRQWQTRRPRADDEIAQDRLAYETAVGAIRRDPQGFLRACLWRLGRLWSPMPQRPGGSIGLGILAVTFFYCGVGLAVLLGLWVLGHRIVQPPWAAALTLVLALAAVHAFYWTNMRMRAPAVPVFAIVAAAACWKLPPRRLPALR